MKVLVVCDLFPPAFSPRMGYLAKYLPANGWMPVILAESVKDEHAFTFLKGEAPVYYIKFYPESKRANNIKWLLTFIGDFFFGYKDRRMYKEARRILAKQSFDLILCSTFRTFPLQAAGKAARKFNLPLVVDLRDIIEQYTGTEYIVHTLPSLGGLGTLFARYFRKRNLNIRNKILEQASCVTTVSPWHVNVLKQYNPQTELIYNGFDPELFYPETIPAKQFTITYTGRLLSMAMRDPSLFMQALSKLAADGIIDTDSCSVNWYVDEASWKIIAREAEKEKVLSFMHFKGYVPAIQIPHILNESSVLLLLANKTSASGPKGIMTTKLFESFAVGKPVLCVRSDESYLEEAIGKTNAGIAARTMEEACNFLLHHFNIWRNTGCTHVEVNKEMVNSFSRKKQAEQFAHIFDRLTSRK